MVARFTREEVAWSFTEAANEPFFNLVNRYVFAPYFAGTLAATATQGASIWGFVLGAAGLAIALLAPTLGAIADSGSRRMPWVVGFMLLAAITCGALWFAAPGVSIWPIAFAVFAATVAVELLVVFTNAYLPQVTPASRAGYLSGICFGISQLAGITALLLVLGVGKSGLLEGLPHGIDRLAGPIAAFAILLFLLPFLFIVRDPRGPVRRASVALGLAGLRKTVSAAWLWPDMRYFMIARMLGTDGMTVVFSFGAVLASASFKWTAESLAVFGIVITIFGALGGFSGGLLDRRIGSKALIITGLGLVLLGAASVMLTDAERLLGVPTGVALGAPLQSPQEIGFLVSGAVIAVGAAFAIGGMRGLMAVMAPPGEATAWFGLFAFVGKATAFVGPFLVGIIALWTGSVRTGVLVSILFLAGAIWAMAKVRSPNQRVALEVGGALEDA